MSASTSTQSTPSTLSADYSELVRLHRGKGHAPRQGIKFSTVDGRVILAAKIKKIVVHDDTPDEQSAYKVRYVPAGKRRHTETCWVDQSTARSLQSRKKLDKLNRDAEAYG